MSGNTIAHDEPGLGEVRSKWGWFVALGIALTVLGVIALANLAMATVASIYYIGALVLLGGLFQVAHAFQVKPWSGFLFWLLSGVLYAVAGLAAFQNPVLAATILTLLLGVALIVSGVFRIWVGTKEREGKGWIIASGAITALAGIVITLGWPVNAPWVIGLFLALDLIQQGAIATAFGFALKRGV